MFKQIFRNRRTKQITTQISQYLIRQHGIHKHYRQDQVDEALTALKLGNFEGISVQENRLAYGVFCTEKEYRAIYQQAGIDGDYEGIQLEIADALYKGKSGRMLGH
ncbi:DUF6559 family protein [Oceanospirillum beijerinckii]|uniref:DUF6559 family protein n=1 Tax=Oceanospirillum beijerinckii TaxID=64976 RepID=UPI000423F551|nr:DUF6559 family protein [Oceanospirillum beijerinckii]MAC47478.1 hypothetical protein [Oceanospirillum sp.]